MHLEKDFRRESALIKWNAFPPGRRNDCRVFESTILNGLWQEQLTRQPEADASKIVMDMIETKRALPTKSVDDKCKFISVVDIAHCSVVLNDRCMEPAAHRLLYRHYSHCYCQVRKQTSKWVTSNIELRCVGVCVWGGGGWLAGCCICCFRMFIVVNRYCWFIYL